METNDELQKVKQNWEEHAERWNQWIGDEGDGNRRESSDPYLWKYIDTLENQVVLDAGCGNGYFSIKLVQETRAQRVLGVDLSSKLIELARSNADRRLINEDQKKRIDFRQDSITALTSIENESVDLIIANYVLMDTPNLDQVVQAFERVLRPSGRVLIVILHPCFDIVAEKNGSNRIYTWTRSYFDETPDTQKWENFCLNIYHRPLSIYFQSFHQHRLFLKDFEEPKFYSRIHQYDFTCSVLFHLQKISKNE